jgi:Zn finger protein HypA/HybF involved in hydrogenase expression
MERMSDYEWFCANCLRMVETLSRHGRCPYCDSNAVDVAYRWNGRGMNRESQAGSMTPALVEAHQ